MSERKCMHCNGTGSCDCEECRTKAGVPPLKPGKVICKSCDGSGKK
jgi:hypothetical protein